MNETKFTILETAIFFHLKMLLLRNDLPKMLLEVCKYPEISKTEHLLSLTPLAGRWGADKKCIFSIYTNLSITTFPYSSNSSISSLTSTSSSSSPSFSFCTRTTSVGLDGPYDTINSWWTLDSFFVSLCSISISINADTGLF